MAFQRGGDLNREKYLSLREENAETVNNIENGRKSIGEMPGSCNRPRFFDQYPEP